MFRYVSSNAIANLEHMTWNERLSALVVFIKLLHFKVKRCEGGTVDVRDILFTNTLPYIQVLVNVFLF